MPDSTSFLSSADRRGWTRREALAGIGAGGGALLLGLGPATPSAAAAAASSCIVRPEQTEGPYFVDRQLQRVDLRSDPSDGRVIAGAPLRLAFAVSEFRSGICAPLAGAVVDVWHCDAQGVYSGVGDRSFDTRGKKFLRGYQVTGAGGTAAFTTIYPGAYAGRAVHVHFKVRHGSGSGPGIEFTSQLYFDDALSDRVLAQAPYRGSRDRIRNADDGIFSDGGQQLLLDVKPASEGYVATFALALQRS